MSNRRFLRAVFVSVALGGLGLSLPLLAQDAPKPEPRPAVSVPANPMQQTGAVTNLPLPRFVSMKAPEGNVRRGPSLTHRIDWVFTHQDMPLQIVGEYGHWRRVLDRDGAGGWMHYALLSGVRTVIIKDDLTPVRAKPVDDAQIRARAEAGTIARLDRCESDWCRIRHSEARGWVRDTSLWGLDRDLGLATTQTAAR